MPARGSLTTEPRQTVRMRRRNLLLGLAALAASGCASDAVAGPQSTAPATLSLLQLDTIDTLSPSPTGPTGPAGSTADRPVPGTTAPAAPRHVAIVGDSLTLSAQDLIGQTLDEAGVVTVTIDAVEGRRINHAVGQKTSGVAATRSIAAVTEPDVWVIALGTNDVPGYGADAYRADVETLLAEIPPDAPVVWVDAWIRSRIDEARAANAALREVVERRSEAVVIDWFQFGDDPGVISGDGIHLTDAGQERFAAQIAAAVLAPTP